MGAGIAGIVGGGGFAAEVSIGSLVAGFGLVAGGVEFWGMCDCG